KKLSVLPIFLAAFVFCAFVADSGIQLMNKTNTVLNEQLFSRLFAQKMKLKVKDQPVDVTVVSFSSTATRDHLRNGQAENDKQTLRVEYQCELLVRVGGETQHIRKNEFWQAPYGTIAVTPPTTEQLIVNTIDKYYKFE
ncbi:MAG TPA: hypothetical protein VGD92_13970, partial [Sphingobacteriaceae bacterium]